MKRILEPELMDDAKQAHAYSHADFSASNKAFVDFIKNDIGNKKINILDLGCGPGDLDIELARQFPEAKIWAVDGAEVMVRLADENTMIYVMDLVRPATKEIAGEIVESVSQKELQILKDYFYNSLLASFTIEEVKQQIDDFPIAYQLEQRNERHFMLKCRMK
jgi:trans-aconitate methyltransferase